MHNENRSDEHEVTSHILHCLAYTAAAGRGDLMVEVVIHPQTSCWSSSTATCSGGAAGRRAELKDEQLVGGVKYWWISSAGSTPGGRPGGSMRPSAGGGSLGAQVALPEPVLYFSNHRLAHLATIRERKMPMAA